MEKYTGQYCDELAQRLYLNNLDESNYFPKYFAIETCNNCNARCIMCPKGQKGTESLQLMTDELFNKIVNEIQKYSQWIEMICLNSDGEPLLDKKIASRIRKLKEVGIKHIQISTNAQLLSEERIQELLESGLDDLRISIDAYTKETYEKIRQGLNYETVKKNTLNLIKMRNEKQDKMEIRIRMVELKENARERNVWMHYWKSQVRETDRVQIMPMHTWSGKITEEKEAHVEYYSDKPCISVFSSMAINYDGIVQLCDSDIEQQEIVGDIRESSIREIWQGEKLEKIRFWHANKKRNLIEICRGCDHWSREFKENK